jgi:hypothetical protein
MAIRETIMDVAAGVETTINSDGTEYTLHVYVSKMHTETK